MLKSKLSLELILGFLLVLSDFVSKYWVVAAGRAYVLNRGVSFGLFGDVYGWVVMAVLLAVVAWYIKAREEMGHKEKVGMVLVLAGGVGNWLSRVFYGGVVDWIMLPMLPAFNLADLIIFSGVVSFAHEYSSSLRRRLPGCGR